ncbi:MAG: hypothetical protein ACRC3H_02595 [Lachnospiraceae bacterium]
MSGRMSNLPETACNIPMPSNVKPPKGKAMCNSCEHEKVCKYSENMEKFEREIGEITSRYEFEMFETTVNCKNRNAKAAFRQI